MVSNLKIVKFLNNRSNSESSKKIEEEIAAFDIKELDQKPFIDCDALLRECENFIELAKRTIAFTKDVHTPNNIKVISIQPVAALNKWRAKRKGNELLNIYEALVHRLDLSEKKMNLIAEKALNHSSSLVLQSLHLKLRLVACIEYNKNELNNIEPLIFAVTSISETLNKNEKCLHSMLIFFDEVERLRKNQQEVYVPWAIRASFSLTPTYGSNNTSSKSTMSRTTISKRFKKVQKVDLFIYLYCFILFF
jgi:succinylglutamate desuccinylase